MKRKLYLFLLTVCIISSANHLHAQISKGTALTGISFNYSTSKNESNGGNTSSQSAFGFSPSYGVFIKQNLVIGGDLSISQSKNDTDASVGITNTQKQNWYGASVFARQYKNLGSSGFYLFLQGNVGANLSRAKSYTKTSSSSDVNSESNGFAIQLGIYPGISYAVTPKFHIETGLSNLLYMGYGNLKTEYTNTPSMNYKSNGFNIGANIGQNTQWSIGARLLIGGKK